MRRSGAYEQNPSYLDRGNGLKFKGSRVQGAILPIERVWTPTINGLPGNIARVTTTVLPSPLTFIKTATTSLLR